MENPIIKNKVVSSRLSIILLIAMAFATVFTCSRQVIAEKQNKALRKEIIDKDKLKMIVDGQYNKVVNDLNSQRQLFTILKKENKSLYDELKNNDRKPIIVIQSESTFKPQNNISEVSTKNTTNTWTDFTDFYPSKSNPFITYTRSKVTDTTARSDWKFSEMKIDLVVSEDKMGIFHADIKGPGFLIINDLKVNSLPLTEIKPDNFDWLGGGGALYNPTTISTKFMLSGGIRYKTYNIIIQSTGDYHGATVLKAF